MNVFVILLTIFLSFSFKAQAQNKDYVLIINTYTESHTWSRPYMDAIHEECLEGSLAMRVSTENLTLLSIDSEEEVDDYARELCKKYGKSTPAAIVYLGNAAWRLLDGRLPAHWQDVPVVVCSENNYVGPLDTYIHRREIEYNERTPIEAIPTKSKLVHLYSPYYVEENVDLIHQIMPSLKKLIFLYDNRNAALQAKMDLVNYIAKKYPELDLLCLNPAYTPSDSLTYYISEKQPDTAVLYLSWTVATSDFGSPIAARVKSLVGNRSSVPVFLLDEETHEMDGLIGGRYRTEEWKKSKILTALYSALSDNTPKFVLLKDDFMPAANIVYPDLLAYGLSPDNCPSDTVFILKPESFFSKYRNGLIGVAVLALIIMLWMAWLNNVRKMQQKQIKLMSEFNNLVNSMPIIYMKGKLVLDKDNQVEDFLIVRYNAFFEKTFGKIKDWTNQPGSAMNPGKFLGNDAHLFTVVHTTQKPVTVQRYFELIDMHMSIIIAPSLDEGYVELFCADNTELANMQQTLHSVNHKLTMALEIANMNPWKWDLKSHTILCDVNRPIEESMEEGELKDDSYFTIPERFYFSNIHPDDKERINKAYDELVAGLVPKIHAEYRTLTHQPDGKVVEDWMEARAAIDQYDEDGEPLTIIGSALKITERKNMETDLLIAKEKADESNRLKSAFLANMSHEIRTPLNAIVGFSQILATAQSEEEKDEYVNIIESNNTLLLQLIGDILDLSKIEAGTLEFNYSAVNIDELFREVEASLRPLMQNSKVFLQYVCEKPGLWAHTDKNRLKQVMINYLNNAVKFTTEGSITFGFRVKSDNKLYCYVTDTGRGIAADKIDAVFDRFTKLDSFAKGTGLGLTICRSIAESMQGKVGAVSQEGFGSTFWIELPYVPAEPVVRNEKEKQVVESSKLDKMTILVAEDNDSNFKLLNSILKDRFYLIHAWDGKEAVEMFKQHNPHLILMDINMPGMDGYEATRLIRELSPTVPIMAVTAFAFAEDEKQILQNGFDAYTSKPVNAKKLNSQITDLLNRRIMFL